MHMIFRPITALNLRTKALVKPSTYMFTLLPGQAVEILEDAEREGWKKVAARKNGTLEEGFVAFKYLRPSAGDAKEALIYAASREWARFNFGKGKEYRDPFSDYVGEMWSAFGLNLTGKNRVWPWSAAFISFIVRKAGYEGFRYAIAHSQYIHDAIVKRRNGEDAPFWGFRLDEHPPHLGDLVCQWRINEADYDYATHENQFPSHCDLIIDINYEKQIVTTLGGNVRNSVNKKEYSLDNNGFLDSSRGSKLFAVLRNNL
jgi:hypothetical protein